ncbi:molybdopterin-dependent oxidoreductase [Rudanella paleaurantiibacter]|uniref:nitrate reductase (cytochrome) n=1 Tax=Rudanella paleaurantiibacter TaxID=2614655 RepID=A0A7J5U004_9BACT|nr:nitrate reductase [Rudanella paleaurantiibacter]KAB7730987.1 molybdopterin-dependent oxidoreductase [Rudanella paleaurantiibacter]
MNTQPSQHRTTCCYCGVGCGIVVNQDATGRLTVTGDKQHPVNRGMLCSKGMNLHYTVMDQSDRLLYPQMRLNRSMPLQRVSWDAALERTAAVFRTLIQKYGPDSVAFYVSGQCLTEEYYLVNKLIKGFIGSNNIDTNSRLCMSSAVVGYKLSLGEDSVPVCYDDIEEADLFLVAGANPAWCHPILWRRLEAHKLANPEVRIICVDPRRTDTARSADLHLPLRPGTDIVLNHAIGRLLIESGQIAPDFIRAHTDGFEAYRALLMQRTLAESAELCGVEADDIRKAADWIGRSKGFLSLWTMGLNQSVVGVNKNLSLINLHLITGRIGKPGNGPFSLTGQPNAMGGREVGGLANLLPGHREVVNAAHRAEMEAFWNSPVRIADTPGLTATEMFDALADSDSLKAIWIINTNPLVSMPDLNRAEKALKNARFVVVQDVSDRADTVAFADVVLPAAAWLEKEGTMTNAERRISYLPRVIDAPGEALPDAEIIWRFAQKMGFGEAFAYQNAQEVYAEYAQSTARTRIDVTGVDYPLLQTYRSVQWPVAKEEGKKGGTQAGKNGGARVESLGTKRLFTDHIFYTSNGRAQIHAVPDGNNSEPTDAHFPLVLTTGRIRDQWHTMTKTGRVAKLNQHSPQPLLEIHPDDARVRGIREGQLVEVRGRRGEVRVKARLTDAVRPGLCFLPMHWGKQPGNLNHNRANNLTHALIDPRSKEPDFKFTAVEVQPYRKPSEKIVIIGAGSAGLGFINAYRALQTGPIRDEIHVFSKEIYPFYNRVLLPDYISGAQSWEQLVKLREDQFAEAGIVVHKGVGIAHIDRTAKVLTDTNGHEHSYDKLLLGTGSRAFMPRGVPRLPGIFNMRSRLDADALLPFLKPSPAGAEPHAVIVGGGLLGLELAASLRQLDVRVTVVQRGGRFMERQLDSLAGELLYLELLDRGIEVYFNEEVLTFAGIDRLEGIQLKSGVKLPCQVVVMAIGTEPNIELAREAGLHCNRGVVVNDYLQTSDPDIFAAGEVAQWNGQMWGVTLAAEQQAETAARFIAGDVSQPYRGSLSMNILKMEGLHLCSMGLAEVPVGAPTGEYEEIIFMDKARRYYKKCIVHNDKLVGAILVGDKNEFAEFRDLIANGVELSEKRLQLLRASKKVDPVQGKLVCSCNTVGQGNLEQAIRAGCTDFGQLCQQTGAGTGCGSCRPEIRSILEAAREREAVRESATRYDGVI